MPLFIVKGENVIRGAQGTPDRFAEIIEAQDAEAAREVCCHLRHEKGFEHVHIREVTEHANPRPFDQVDRWGDVFTDRAEFAAALAPLIGGTFTRDPEYPAPSQSGVMRIELDSLAIVIHAEHGANSRGRLRLSIYASRDLRNEGGVRFPDSIRLDSGRPLETLARDVRRRLIEPAAAPLAALREKVAAAQLAQNAAESLCGVLAARFPTARFSLSSDKLQVDVSGSAGVYLSGRMRDGRLYIERAGSFEPVHSLAILAAIFGAQGKDS